MASSSCWELKLAAYLWQLPAACLALCILSIRAACLLRWHKNEGHINCVLVDGFKRNTCCEYT